MVLFPASMSIERADNQAEFYAPPAEMIGKRGCMIDASLTPIHVCANTAVTVYAIVEKGATSLRRIGIYSNVSFEESVPTIQ